MPKRAPSATLYKKPPRLKAQPATLTKCCYRNRPRGVKSAGSSINRPASPRPTGLASKLAQSRLPCRQLYTWGCVLTLIRAGVGTIISTPQPPQHLPLWAPNSTTTLRSGQSLVVRHLRITAPKAPPRHTCKQYTLRRVCSKHTGKTSSGHACNHGQSAAATAALCCSHGRMRA